jgi:hypothetical protein
MDTRYGDGEACCGVIRRRRKNSFVGGRRGVKGVSDSRVFKQKGKIK